MSRVTIYNMDVMKFFESNSTPMFHGALFDPPYGYDGGFMDETWDKDPIVFRQEFWVSLMKVMHETAIGFAFASPENSHKMSTAIEESGAKVLPRNYLWATGRSKPRFFRISNTHVYGKHSVKPSVEPVIAFQSPMVSKSLREAHEKSGSGSYNIGGVNVSTDGKFRFPSSLVIDHDAAREMSAPSKDVSAYFTVLRRMHDENEVFYSDKAGRSERDAGLEEMPDTKVGVLSGRRDGSLGSAPIGKNDHPTVKPIAVGTHFASLILPPDSVKERTLIVPFLGTGSEAIGALSAGWDNVVGIEISERYCRFSLARIREAHPSATVELRG